MTVLLPASVQKEVRALLTVWAGCMLAVTAAVVSHDRRIVLPAMFAYGLGALALGAQSVGHEYSHGTLAALLAQPVDRSRVYATKLGVLAAMLLPLGAMAWQMPYGGANARHLMLWRDPPVSLLPMICGVCLAPWFTMVCRSPIAGIVFTFVLPLSLLLAGDLFGAARYGGANAAGVDRFKLAVMWWGTLTACALAAVAGWRRFVRLESIDGPGAQIDVPQWFRAAAARPVAQHPLWALVKKELHLQQMTFVVVLLYVCGWAAALSIAGRTSADVEMAVIPLTVIYLGLLSILIGSLASAEERQHGTLEWQMVAPMAAWQQWVVKAGAAIGLAMLLGVALPMALNFIHAAGGDLRAERIGRSGLVVVTLFTVSSLYVSSLCSSGVKAVVLALPVGLGASLIAQGLQSVATWIVFDADALAALARPLHSFIEPSLRAYARWSDATRLGLAAAYALLMLRLAFINHRSAERGSGRIWRQALWIAVFGMFAFLLLAFAVRVFRT